jgi:hypothetical protein
MLNKKDALRKIQQTFLLRTRVRLYTAILYVSSACCGRKYVVIYSTFGGTAGFVDLFHPTSDVISCSFNNLTSGSKVT